jgi:hypothetical protein
MTARMTLCTALAASLAALALSLRAPAAEPAGLPPKTTDPVGGFFPINPNPPAITVDRPETAPQPADRAITCPANAFPESEVNCGNPTDTINGGCGSPLQGFSTIFCNATICGTTRFDGATRDTDWYQFSLNAQRQVTVRVAADFKCVFGFVSGTNGVANCALATGVSPFGVTLPGQTQEVTACLGPGVWWVFVGPDFAQGNLACGTKYWVKLECTTPCPVGACCMANNACVETAGPSPCVTMGGRYQGDDTFCGFGGCTPPSNDSCANAITVTCNSTVFADTRNATLDPQEPLPVCAQGIATGSVWYRVVGTGGRLGVTTCDSASLDPYAKDSVIAVYRAGNGCVDPSPITCNDDSSCGPQLRLSRVCFNTFPNAVYLIQVLPFSNLSRGVFKVDIECVCTEVPTTGACCLANAGCSSVSQAACETLLGSYRGDGTTCAAAACPNIPTPANDECDASTPYIGVPGTVTGYTLYGFPDADQSLAACGPPPSGPGVWYRVLGNGRELTASLCGNNLDFDARIFVFCGDCATSTLVCAAANDDGANPSCAVAPEVTWCSELNRTYSILVAAGTGDSGNFTLTMSSASTPCANPASCVQNCTITYPQGAVSENEPACGTGFVDTTNGGCGVPNTPKGTILCGQTVSGTSGSYTATINSIGRDTDWFRFTLTQASTVTWTVKAEFLAQAIILNDNCNDQQVFAFAQGNACQNIAATATLEPGTYNVFVSPQFFGDTTCGSKWYGTLTCAASAANGACCLTRCSCIVTSENDCLFNRFGIYFAGPGTTCAQTNCNPCPADMTGDGVVNTADLVKFLGSFGRDLRGDFNCSGATNTADLVFFLGRFGMICPP